MRGAIRRPVVDGTGAIRRPVVDGTGAIRRPVVDHGPPKLLPAVTS